MDNNETKPTVQQRPVTSSKIGEVSSQVNLGANSPTHQRFARLKASVAPDISSRDFVDFLMASYENPHVDTDNSEVIANLNKQIGDLKGEIASNEATRRNLELEIDNLKLELATARNEANDNAAKAQQIQTATDGAIIVKPNPVSAYFLNEMAEREKTTPAKILERLFIDDLQNPRANNLPYTVSSSRIREVMDKLRKEEKQ